MPLSKIQTDALRLLAAQRDPESYVVGGVSSLISQLVKNATLKIYQGAPPLHVHHA